MDDFVVPLPLPLDVQSLTMALVSVASPRGREGALAGAVEAALRGLPHLAVERTGDTVVARTDEGHDQRVVVAAHLDVASAQEPLAYVEMGKLFGPGASDAKGALAVLLKTAALGRYRCDVTFVVHPGGTPADRVGAELRAADVVLLAGPTRGAVRGRALDHPWVSRLIALTDVAPVPDAEVAPDLAAVASPGVPVVAFGPGDPSLAGTAEEFVATAELGQSEFVLRQWLTA